MYVCMYARMHMCVLVRACICVVRWLAFCLGEYACRVGQFQALGFSWLTSEPYRSLRGKP